MCAPDLRCEVVIAEDTKTDIARPRSVKRANEILYDYLRGNCTINQIVTLSRVLLDIDCGFGRTRKLGQRLHARIQGPSGGSTYQQEWQHGSQLHPSVPNNETSSGD